VNATLTKTQIWGAPILFGIVSVVGLVSALLADGSWDVLSWLALAAPVAVCIRGLWRPRRLAGDKRMPLENTRHS
jgi:hypothetical protein